MTASGARVTIGYPPMVTNLQFNLLSDPQSIVHLDAQVSDGAFKLGVTEQNLHGSEVAVFL